MNRLNIDATGGGPHTLIPAKAGTHIMVERFVITFSHDAGQSQPISFWSDAMLVAGPFYVLDGAVFDYERLESRYYSTAIGGDFKINLAPDMKAAGFIEYELGAK